MLAYAVAAVLAASNAAPVQVLPAERIEAQVRSALAERLARISSDAQVQVQSMLREQTLPAGAVAIRVGEIAGRWPRTRIAVPVRLLVDGQAVRDMTVRVELHDKREVLTYAAGYAAHRAFAALRLVPAVVDMTCCAGSALAEKDQSSDVRLKRAVRAGQPVMIEDFEAVPEVVAREPVEIEVTLGRIHLATTGVALHDGRTGDKIDVRASASGETVQARVVAKQKVIVDE